MFCHLCRPVISHRSSLDDHVLLCTSVHDSLVHILSRCYVNHIDKSRRFYLHLACDQGDVRPSEHGLSGNGISHLACGVIRYISDRVYGLTGRACRNQKSHPGHILFFRYGLKDIILKNLRIRELALACVSTCKVSSCGFQYLISI